MWTHPITILGLTALIGCIGWLVKMILENNKVVYAVAETVKEIQAEQKAMRKEFDELRGEHHMMLRAGEIISRHNFDAKKNLHQ